MYFQTQNSVYEVLSDVNSRQDVMDERIASMEDRMNSIQCSLDVLPDILTRSILISFQIVVQAPLNTSCSESSWTLVGLTFILSTPLSGRFCLGRWEFGRNG